MTALTTLPAAAYWLLIMLLAGLPLLILQNRLGPTQRRMLWSGRWVLIAYIGLLSGGLSPRLMGLRDYEWMTTLGPGLGMTVLMIALVAGARLTLFSREPQIDTGAHPPRSERRSWQNGESNSSWMVVGALIGLLAGAEQFYWSALRAAIWEVLAYAPDAFRTPLLTAAGMALLLALPEAILRLGGDEERIGQFAIALSSVVLFLVAQNFWLCWILHAATRLLLMPRTDVADLVGSANRPPNLTSAR